MSRLAHIACLLALLLPLGTESANYNVFIDERSLQEPCDSEDDKGNMALSELVDLSGLTTALDHDYETLYISGDITFKQTLPPQPIKFEADISRWDRGMWVPTFISLKRNNFCNSLKDPMELWHLYLITQVPKALRTCPPRPGKVYSLRNLTNRIQVMNLPRWDIEGDLRSVIHLTVGHLKACLLIYCTVSLF